MENLLKEGRGIFIADKYTDHGKWMDGWESRRKRTPGNDWCIIKLAVAGIIKGVDIDLFPTLEELERMLGNTLVETINIPHDCTDGFMCAYWRRPEAYLDSDVRQAISTFSRISNIQNRLDILRDEINSGEWHKKYGYLLDKESLDLGYRLVVSETSSVQRHTGTFGHY